MKKTTRIFIDLLDAKGKIVKTISRTLISAPSGQEFFRWKGREVEVDDYDHETGHYQYHEG